MLTYLRQLYWHRRLRKLVARQRNSYECQRFRERRAAALKATRYGYAGPVTNGEIA